MDMFLMIYPVADLVPLGGEHTSLGAMAATAARAAGFDVSPDPYPEEVRFIRSDQYSFVKAGIPAIHLKPGNKSTDPSIDGAKLTRDWLRTIYHSPKDDLSQTFDFASGARYAETNLRLVRAIANAPRGRRGRRAISSARRSDAAGGRRRSRCMSAMRAGRLSMTQCLATRAESRRAAARTFRLLC